MKHITTLIALALTLGTLVPLAAQTKMTAKEKRTQTSKRTIIPRRYSCLGKQHVCIGSRSPNFQTRQIGKCQFCQKLHFHGKQKSHGTSQF